MASRARAGPRAAQLMGELKTFTSTPPPLGHYIRVTSSTLREIAPPVGHSQAHTPLDIVRVTSSARREIETPPLLDIHKHPPLDVIRVTSSALRKIENHPPLDIARVTSSTFQGGGVIGFLSTTTKRKSILARAPTTGPGPGAIAPPAPPLSTPLPVPGRLFPL